MVSVFSWIAAKPVHAADSYTKLACNQDNAQGVSVGAGFVFWAQYAFPGSIFKLPVNADCNTVPTVLASGLATPTQTAYSDGFLYFTDVDAGTVSVVSINGGTVTNLASGLFQPRGLAVEGGYVFWTELGGNCGACANGGLGFIKKVPTSGGQVETLTSGLDQPYALSSWGGMLFWTEHGTSNRVKSMPENGGSIVTLATASNAPNGITVDGSFVYYAVSGSNGEIDRVPMSGGTVDTLANNIDDPVNLVVSGNVAYFTEFSAGNVKAVDIATRQVTVLASTLVQPWDIATDGSFVYFTTSFCCGIDIVGKVPSLSTIAATEASVASGFSSLFSQSVWSQQGINCISDMQTYFTDNLIDPTDILTAVVIVPESVDLYKTMSLGLNEFFTTSQCLAVADVNEMYQQTDTESNLFPLGTYPVQVISQGFGNLAPQLSSSQDITQELMTLKGQLIAYQQVIENYNFLLVPASKDAVLTFISSGINFIDALLVERGVSDLTVVGHSPINLFLTDPNGMKIGADPLTNLAVDEEKLGLYNGPGAEPQIIIVLDPPSGTYDILAKGTASGNYVLDINLYTPASEASQSYPGHTVAGQNTELFYVVSGIQPVGVPEFALPVTTLVSILLPVYLIIRWVRANSIRINSRHATT